MSGWSNKTSSSAEGYNYDDGGRPRIDKTGLKSKFRPNDRVYLQTGRALQGPFLIESVLRPQIYTLCLENGEKANGGAEVAENLLTLA
ncbi:uncharacterized protein F4807DRAFT_418081 [Annulohypoxylon truncatum]|uniref:uncharacterized protein n=1 Tax=Annulohypoxylon truncatum TaxID=327061 RepID=UPI0020076A47|nr:uncharacterized protein F4807DRAFT_418081 [Annulohypoxylon truncatum]KAI1211533.1 hypothetical protein F4807DRAFT_418081 [Annulohypoxylon truncatum]